MRFILQRLFHDSATIGTLTVEGEAVPLAWTLEDKPQAVKVPGETRIPAGVYSLRLKPYGGLYERYLPRFPWNAPGMLELEEVPGFSDVLMHCGNTHKHTAGCPLVGDGAFIDEPMMLSRSVEAYQRVYSRAVKVLLSDGSVTLEVKNEPVAEMLARLEAYAESIAELNTQCVELMSQRDKAQLEAGLLRARLHKLGSVAE